MLDLNFLRENFETVRKALESRNFPTAPLDKFAELDAERRRVIGEADKINQLRNSSSKEIGALMQSGRLPEAEAKKAEVAGLKEKQAELGRAEMPEQDWRIERLGIVATQLGDIRPDFDGNDPAVDVSLPVIQHSVPRVA